MKMLQSVTLVIFGLHCVPALADNSAGIEAYKHGDYTRAFKEWKPLAEQGDAKAQNNLGYLYSSGQGVLQDYDEARKWFGLAAEQGDESAKRWLKAIEGRHNSLQTQMLRLSLVQLIHLILGILFALVVVFLGSLKIHETFSLDVRPNPTLHRRSQVLSYLGPPAALAFTLFIYYCGGLLANRLATKLGCSRVDSLINSVYSWGYIASSFLGWMGDHRHDPIGQAVSQFIGLMR